MTWPYNSDPDEVGITHADGEDTVRDIISTFPDCGTGDGNPQEVTVRKPRP